jgi:predicted transposase YbfD/YdcC
VLSRLKPDELPPGFVNWPETRHESLDGEVVAIAGKTLRRSFDHAASQGAIPLRSAWAHAKRLGLGQRQVEDKSNDITARPTLLRLGELAGALVTIDAMGCQKAMATTMTEQGAASVFALTATHPTLPSEGHLFCDDVKAERLDPITSARHTTTDAAHGRLETRHSWLTSASAC